MAGAKICFCSHTDKVVDIRSSAIPFPTLQRILAVAGAITIKSISKAKSICSNPPFGFSGNKFVMTLLLDSAAKVDIPINSCAAVEMAT